MSHRGIVAHFKIHSVLLLALLLPKCGSLPASQRCHSFQNVFCPPPCIVVAQVVPWCVFSLVCLLCDPWGEGQASGCDVDAAFCVNWMLALFLASAVSLVHCMFLSFSWPLIMDMLHSAKTAVLGGGGGGGLEWGLNWMSKVVWTLHDSLHGPWNSQCQFWWPSLIYKATTVFEWWNGIVFLTIFVSRYILSYDGSYAYGHTHRNSASGNSKL